MLPSLEKNPRPQPDRNRQHARQHPAPESPWRCLDGHGEPSDLCARMLLRQRSPLAYARREPARPRRAGVGAKEAGGGQTEARLNESAGPQLIAPRCLASATKIAQGLASFRGAR